MVINLSFSSGVGNWSNPYSTINGGIKNTHCYAYAIMVSTILR